jgi:hypothetical protein
MFSEVFEQKASVRCTMYGNIGYFRTKKRSKLLEIEIYSILQVRSKVFHAAFLNFWRITTYNFATVLNVRYFLVLYLFRIKDLEELQYLYPDMPKDDAFGKFYSKIEGKI